MPTKKRFDILAVPVGGVFQSYGFGWLHAPVREAYEMLGGHERSLRDLVTLVESARGGAERGLGDFVSWLDEHRSDAGMPSDFDCLAVLALLFVQDAVRILEYPADAEGLRPLFEEIWSPEVAGHYLDEFEPLRQSVYADRKEIAASLGHEAIEAIQEARKRIALRSAAEAAKAEAVTRTTRSASMNETRHRQHHKDRDLVWEQFDREWRRFRSFKEAATHLQLWLRQAVGKEYRWETIRTWVSRRAREIGVQYRGPQQTPRQRL